LANVEQIFSPETAWPNGTKLGRKHRTLHRCFLPSLAPFDQAVSEEIFLIVANPKKELLLAAMFIGRMKPNEEAL
jgi:hypothetical protein